MDEGYISQPGTTICDMMHYKSTEVWCQYAGERRMREQDVSNRIHKIISDGLPHMGPSHCWLCFQTIEQEVAGFRQTAVLAKEYI